MRSMLMNTSAIAFAVAAETVSRANKGKGKNKPTRAQKAEIVDDAAYAANVAEQGKPNELTPAEREMVKALQACQEHADKEEKSTSKDSYILSLAIFSYHEERASRGANDIEEQKVIASHCFTLLGVKASDAVPALKMRILRASRAAELAYRQFNPKTGKWGDQSNGFRLADGDKDLGPDGKPYEAGTLLAPSNVLVPKVELPALRKGGKKKEIDNPDESLAEATVRMMDDAFAKAHRGKGAGSRGKRKAATGDTNQPGDPAQRMLDNARELVAWLAKMPINDTVALSDDWEQVLGNLENLADGVATLRSAYAAQDGDNDGRIADVQASTLGEYSNVTIRAGKAMTSPEAKILPASEVKAA